MTVPTLLLSLLLPNILINTQLAPKAPLHMNATPDHSRQMLLTFISALMQSLFNVSLSSSNLFPNSFSTKNELCVGRS